jgi:hypothetical protein
MKRQGTRLRNGTVKFKPRLIRPINVRQFYEEECAANWCPCLPGSAISETVPKEARTPLNPADKEARDVSKFGSNMPMKRPAQPEELAPAYVFLASSHCSSYITAEILPVVGGY